MAVEDRWQLTTGGFYCHYYCYKHHYCPLERGGSLTGVSITTGLTVGVVHTCSVSSDGTDSDLHTIPRAGHILYKPEFVH